VVRNNAIQDSVLIGKITPQAAKILGIPEGTPTQDALQSYYARQLQIAGLLGNVPDILAEEHGFESGGSTVDNRLATGKINYDYSNNNGYYDNVEDSQLYGDETVNTLSAEVEEFIGALKDGEDIIKKATEYAKKNNIDVEEFLDAINMYYENLG
jgi:hypothetical protein